MLRPRILPLAPAKALLTLLVLWSAASSAHPLAPALLELREAEGGRAQVRWKVSKLRPRGVELVPVPPSGCIRDSETVPSEDAQSVTFSWWIDCGDGPLVGRSLRVDGLEQARIDVLARVLLLDGRKVSAILSGSGAELVIPERQSKARVLGDYLWLGCEHILTGPDHLLFVLGLLLLVAGPRPLVKTITAFTVGHSITLSIVALELASVPSGPVELLIAISVLALAVELAQPEGGRRSLLRRRPWLMALSFGLLHGMGFAGALSEIGLPQEEIPLALFAFNVGIEIGQLAFVFTLLALWWLVRGRFEGMPGWLRLAPAYGIGSLAAFWCLERGAAILP